MHKQCLDKAADPTMPCEIARDGGLHNMILSAVCLGHTHNIVEKVKDDERKGESGFYAWTDLKEWHLDPSQKSVMLDYYLNKLDLLILDGYISATEFINSFDVFV